MSIKTTLTESLLGDTFLHNSWKLFTLVFVSHSQIGGKINLKSVIVLKILVPCSQV